MSQGQNAATTQGFFLRPWPVRIILGSFFVLTLPLALATLLAPQWMESIHAASVYFIAIGNTHFLLTFALYFQSGNRRHFLSSRLNTWIYFVIPVAIFLSFDLYRTFAVASRFPDFDRAFMGAVRFFNFYHAGRQSFGVLQLFKKRAGASYPPWLRRWESGAFYALILLMMDTFLDGGVLSLGSLTTRILLGILVVMLLGTVVGHARTLRQAVVPHAVLVPLAYYLLQTASLGFAVYSTALYIFALAMHYVEYHVVMYPRCFHSELGQSWGDRVFGTLRASRLLFYVLLLNAAGIVAILVATQGRQWAPGTTALLSLADGLFVFHYFVEAFVWKFGNPHYRRTLGPLFFGAPAIATQTKE